MCGIVGAIAFNDYAISAEYITAMRDAMVHRGPDGAGVWVSPKRNVGLGHRRLSIIDLSEHAAQPMRSQDGRFVLTFNGEIYNHKDIRRELIQLGVNDWQTDHSDTEVLLNAFRHWGIDCLEKFRGMFAFAIWDNQEQTLWLVRDRLGIKPLYFSQHNGRLTFASEIKALLRDPAQQRAINEESFFHYLSFLTPPAPDTLFAGIHKLPCGSWLKIKNDGQIQEHKYWDVLDHVTPLQNHSDAELAEMVQAELRTAVKLRKESDVPVGVFLSGGIDSSTNAALFSEDSDTPINTFSIGYEGKYDSYQNELHFAKQMAHEVSANYHERLLNVDDLMNFLPQMIHLQDEPIADPVCVPVYYVSELARKNGTIVCQVGEGADELFCGYPSWKVKLNLQQLSAIPGTGLLKRMGLGLLGAANKKHTLYYELLRRGTMQQPVFWGGAESFTEYQKQHLLSPRLQKQFAGRTSWEAIEPLYQQFQSKAWDPHWLNWMSYLDLNFRLPELLLMRVDKMSMGVSLEGRVPFLDHKFVELAMSIPAKQKIKQGTLKHLLKKSVQGLIPDELIHRKKQGFGVPIYEWLFDKLGDKTRQELTHFCEQTDLLNPQAVNTMIEQKHGHQLWYLLNLALWWKHYIQTSN